MTASGAKGKRDMLREAKRVAASTPLSVGGNNNKKKIAGELMKIDLFDFSVHLLLLLGRPRSPKL